MPALTRSISTPLGARCALISHFDSHVQQIGRKTHATVISYWRRLYGIGCCVCDVSSLTRLRSLRAWTRHALTCHADVLQVGSRWVFYSMIGGGWGIAHMFGRHSESGMWGNGGGAGDQVAYGRCLLIAMCMSCLQGVGPACVLIEFAFV